MAKQIIILRHAHTEPYSENGEDFSRNLTANGFDDAGKIGEKIVATGLMPQTVYCSTAARTRQTLEEIWPHWGASAPQIEHSDDYYLASAGDLLAMVNELPDTIDKVMLVGHNPGLHQLVQLLSGTMLPNFSPSTCAVMQSEHVNWQEIAPESMKLAEILLP